jgi:hypothetical protein
MASAFHIIARPLVRSTLQGLHWGRQRLRRTVKGTRREVQRLQKDFGRLRRRAARSVSLAFEAVVRPVQKGTRRSCARVRESALELPGRVQASLRELYFQYRLAPWGPAFFGTVANLRAPADTLRRRRLAERYRAQSKAIAMPADTGYARLSPGDLPGLDRVLAICRGIFEAKIGPVGGDVRADSEGKRGFLRNLLTNEDLQANPELIEFALSEELLGAASVYLGAIPNLNRVDLLYSVPRAGDGLAASQFFHLDPEGLTQAKVFINIFDVHDPQGPFTFIPADHSRRLVQEIGAQRRKAGVPIVGRYTDEEIAELGGADAAVEISGGPGSGVIVDTSRCLHCGSRVQPGAFRLCLYIQYCRSREIGNVFDPSRFARDPVRYLALVQSRASAGAKVAAPHQMA